MTDFDPKEYKLPGDDAESYYKQLDAKHFDKATATGSVFTAEGINNHEDLLRLAYEQRGNLRGDDRDKFFGVNPDVFFPGSYYLRIQIDGLAGDTRAGDLDPNTPVVVKRTKDGVPPDYVVLGGELRKVSHATLIMVDERSENGQATGRRVLITAFPGDPAPPAGKDREEHLDGEVLRAGELNPSETILIDPTIHRSMTIRPAKPAAPDLGF